MIPLLKPAASFLQEAQNAKSIAEKNRLIGLALENLQAIGQHKRTSTPKLTISERIGDMIASLADRIFSIF